ncbi:hypothetical protein, conserved [Leishmania tarentolae]|uniref:Rab-GAP TBC domain-containing protein n=1 Tax=Leishmania tarentolae TaxID=5689 RepID=A0A640KVK4_LEITA|nr:hypothetical protein, conserved [Leishmania tarentolae]
MAVQISSTTVVTSLWGEDDVTAIPLHPNGQFLSLRLSPAAITAKNIITSVAFHPVDESCFVLGTEAGKAYGVSLQENKLFLLVDVGERGALRCATFCPGYLTSPIVVFAGNGSRLLFLDWQRGTILQDVRATMHNRPILRIVTGASTESLFCAVSADAVSCWEPLSSSEGAHVIDPLSFAIPVTGSQRSSRTWGTAGVSPKDRTPSRFSTPRYGCSGSVLPTECTLELQRNCDIGPRLTNKTSHRFLGVHILHPSLLVSVESNGVLSLWSRAATGGGDDLAKERPPLRLQQSATTPSVLRVHCSAQCGKLIVLGADAATVDELGDHVEPVVAFVVGQTLEGAGIVRLPRRGTGATAKDRAIAVTQVSPLQSDCVACLLSTGVVHVVLPSTFHLVFSIPPPSIGKLDHRLSPRSQWNFTPSGPTFGTMWCDDVLLVLHLPTARRTDAGAAHAIETSTVRTGSRSTPSSGAVVGKERTPIKLKTSRMGSGPDDAVEAANGGAVVAQSFLRSSQGARSTPSRLTGASASAHSGADAALAVLSRYRPPIVVPKKGFPAVWPDFNEVDLRAVEQALTSRSASDPGEADKDTSANGPRVRPSTAAFCDTLSPSSCQYNVNQLQAHLVKHGVFPHEYRPAIWRFLAGLPSTSKTASQFAALARRPPHLAVSQLMSPFPLPPSSTRDTVESALSCLCWASPVFTLASYLPVLVYPLSMVFRDDVQSVVEFVLIFFLNWGKDFFVCHPHGPTSLLMAMERQLRRLDEPLCQHLDAMGAGVSVWGWELLTSFFTDSFTGAEWVQVMDHIVTAAPLFLFAFHVTFVETRLRPALTSALCIDEVRGVLRRAPADVATPQGRSSRTSMQRLIEEAYRLYHNWSCESTDSATDLSSFKVFQTLSPQFEYPVNFVHDSVVLAEKLRELSLLQQSRDEEKRAADRLEALRKASEAASAEEAAFVLQQRARVSAKYDASAAAWQVYAAVERSRQEKEAEERQLRWEVLQKRTRNAEELEALRAEMNMVECQLRHDMVDRHMEQLKWRLAAHLTDEELARLQNDADAQVERAVQRIEEYEQQHAEEALHYATASLLSIEVPPGDEGDASAKTSASPAHGVEDLHLLTKPSSTATLAEERCDDTRQQTTQEDGGVHWRRQECETASEMQAPGEGVYAGSEPPGGCVVVHENPLAGCLSSHSAADRRNASSSVSVMAVEDTEGHTRGSLDHRSQTTTGSHFSMSNSPAAVNCSANEPRKRKLQGRAFEKANRSGKVDLTGSRQRFMPPPRHAYCDATAEHGETALNQRRFLELRDRVMSRVDTYTQHGKIEDPLRRYRPPYRGDGSTTVTTSCTGTLPATSSCPSSCTERSSTRHLFDNYEPDRRRADDGKYPYDHQQQRRQPQPAEDSYTATMTMTSPTSSKGQSRSSSPTTTSSYESPSTYTSYDYEYSATVSTTWRTGETRSAGSTAHDSPHAHATRPRSDRVAPDDGCRHICASRH